MKRLVARRLLAVLPVVFGVLTLVFLIIHLIPGDPVEIMLGERATTGERDRLREALGLNRPVWIQYLDFLKNAVTGDLGVSLHSQKPVWSLVLERFPATLELALAAMAFAVCLAIPLGVLAAAKRNTAIDRGSLFIALLGVSMPNFWLGPMLIIVFSIELGWFPVSGRGGLSHLILPAVTLGTAMAAILTRMTRSSMLEVIREDFVTVARAKGLTEFSILVKHGLSNALLPILTVIGLQFGALLAGAIITETIFSWPGVGRLTIQAIQTRDYPLVQGCVLMISLGYVFVNLMVDLLYSVVDPRVKYE
jgi:peptide/nickel transport system permease protein